MNKPAFFSAGLVLALAVGASLAVAADSNPRPLSKDVGPANTACDMHDKGSAAWIGCVGQANAALKGDEAFYAGYWLAKSGKFAEALAYLKEAPQTDPRVLTYIGFATRKLGDVDAAFAFYDKALALNPDYSVARAYLGEAHLACDAPDQADAQLKQIALRSGEASAEYADLARQLADYRVADYRGSKHNHKRKRRCGTPVPA